MFLNLGDSYVRNLKKGGSGPNGKHDYIPSYGDARKIMSESKGSSDGVVGCGDRAPVRVGAEGLKQKDLMMVPARAALALQADGWYLRSDITWVKPNPMPESVTDRPTSAHEHVFMFSKSERYFYDSSAIAEPSVSDHKSGNGFKRDSRLSYQDDNGPRGNDEQWDKLGGTRNARNVWTITPQPFKEAHFATFPPALAERCILAGSRVCDIVLDPFGGAGTTGMAADRLNRWAYLIEINPEYADMAQRRIQADRQKRRC